MRILYVYDGDWPKGAIRVLKEIRSLAQAGHTVQLVCRNQSRDARRVVEEYATVRRLPAVGPQWFNYALNFPYFFNPLWFWEIYRGARELRAEAILVADLPLAPTALWVGRLLRIPVHFDMVEVYPEFLRSLWQFEDMGWSDHVVRSPRLAELIERWVIRGFRTVFVVSEESKERCQSLGVPPERLVILGNTPINPELLAAEHPMPADLLPWKHHQRILFVGTIIRDRGVVEAVEAIAEVAKHFPKVVLIVVGDGPERSRVEQAIARMGVQEHVALLGWKDHSELTAYYKHAMMGLLPFLNGSHVRITLANKLFDYMGAGLPVVASDLPSTRRVLEETGAGVLADPGNPLDLARAMLDLLSDPGKASAIGLNGLRAVASQYSWKHDEKRLLEALTRP